MQLSHVARGKLNYLWTLRKIVISFILLLPFLFFFFFLGLHLPHMEVPRLGVKSELQLLAYATATAMPDLSCIYDPGQPRNLNPLSDARNRTWILIDTCWVLNSLSHSGNSCPFPSYISLGCFPIWGFLILFIH